MNLNPDIMGMEVTLMSVRGATQKALPNGGESPRDPNRREYLRT